MMKKMKSFRNWIVWKMIIIIRISQKSSLVLYLSNSDSKNFKINSKSNTLQIHHLLGLSFID